MMHPSSPDLDTPESDRPEKTNDRTCAGCGKKAAPRDMLRVVLGLWQDGQAEIAVDFAGRAFGRGAHVHFTRECFEKAATGGFSKSFKTKVRADAEEMVKDVLRGSERTVSGLVSAAVARRDVGIGADAAKDAMQKGAPLLLVASDAGTISREFPAAVAEGRTRVFSDKATLGKLAGKSEVSVLAIVDAKIAAAIKQAIEVADEVRWSRSEACWSPEVR